MRKEFAKIFQALEIEGSFAEDLRRRVLSRCETQIQATDILRKLDHEEKEDNCSDNIALYDIFRSCAYDVLKNKEASFTEAANALRRFRNCGNDFNEAMAKWYIGLLYKSYKEYHLALPELDGAEKILRRCVRFHELESDYEKKALCEEFAQEVKTTITDLETKKTTSASQGSPSLSSLWNMASLIFGIYDIAHASHVGKFVFDDDIASKVEVEQIVIEGKPYNLFNCRGGTEITITSNGDYRWLKVEGTSMNQATPVSIDPHDYALVDLKLAYGPGDIVIASFNNPPTPEERAGVIKRFTLRGLESESSNVLALIPLEVVEIRGVVIAIAKPA